MVEYRTYRGHDGTRLAFAELGDGPAVLLLHGLFSNGETNWQQFGTAKAIAAAGYRVILPDFRGHGHSDTPSGPAGWPEDILAMDIEALVSELALRDFVLGGYSLGCRTSVRLLLRSMQPRAAILAGMGLDGVLDLRPRADFYINMIRHRGQWPIGSPEHLAERFMKANIESPEAMVWLLEGQPKITRAALAELRVPALVLRGADDHDHPGGGQLAAALPDAIYREVPGNHMNCITRPAFAAAICDFLGRVAPVSG